MKYKDCITLTMQVLTYLLENGWEFANEENFNESNLKLKDNGFVLEEKSRFNGEYTYGYQELSVSPVYIISLLFGDYNNDEHSENSLVTKVGRILPEEKFSNSISYIPIVSMLDIIRNNSYRREITDSIEDINYTKLKKFLKQYKSDDYVSLKNQVLSLKNLSYGELTNLRINKQGLARKIERMYQVETLLEKFCKMHVLETQGKMDPYFDYYEDYTDYEDYIDYTEKLARVNLEKEEAISWSDYCNTIRRFNEIEVHEVNRHFEHEKEYYNKKITALGLDELVLPGSPQVYKKYYR